MKAVSIILFLTIALFASDNKDIMRAQILEKIILNISINETITVWSDNKELLAGFRKSNHLIISDICDKATVIIIENKKELNDDTCKNKPIFVLNYNLLKEVPKSFGAFFWKKGRPNIVIIESRIKSQNISVSKELNAYIEEKVW
ncbi:MAG: hypothetical protein PHV62_00680 [Sulfuricurvum sp.]|nr:hypothetical protein [Sulfuricurvum sp.]